MKNNGTMKKTITIYAIGIILLLIEYSANFSAKVIGTFFKGRNIIVPEILNIKCENATMTAASLPVTNAAIIAVIVVPIFAPKVYGKI